MVTNRNNGSPEDIDTLKKENAALQEQLKSLKAERDVYRNYVQFLAKQTISEEVVQAWMAEERAEGTMLDFIEEVRREG